MFCNFFFCSLTVLFCFFSNHCAAHNIRTPCASIDKFYEMNSVNHAKGNYHLGKMLDDDEKKENSDQSGDHQGVPNGQPKVGNFDSNGEVEETIKNAQEKIKNAEMTINNILNNALAAQNDVNNAVKKELKEIEDAKAEANKMNSSTIDASQFVLEINQAMEKAKEKIKEYEERATSAVTKATTAKTKLQSAKDQLNEAVQIKEENQNDQKKQKASDAGKNADIAVDEAKSSETDQKTSSTTLSEVKSAYTDVHVALYKLKTIVDANKVNKVYESIDGYQKSIEEANSEVDVVVRKVEKTFGLLMEPLKENGRKQHEICKNSQIFIQNEVKKMKKSEEIVKKKKISANKAVQEVKARNSIDETKKEYEKVEKALLDATAEEEKAYNALNNSTLELKKMKKVESLYDVILKVDNVYFGIKLSKEYESKAKQNEQSAISNISEIKAMKADDMTEENQRKIINKLNAAEKVLKNLQNYMKQVTETSNNAEKYKAVAERAVEEAEKESDSTSQENTKSNSHSNVLTVLKEIKNATLHLRKVIAEGRNIEKLHYEAKTVFLTHKITKVVKVAKGYVEEANEKEKEAEIFFIEIKALLINNLTDMREKVAQQVNAANEELQQLKDKAIDVYSASRNVENQNEEANDAMNNALKSSSVTYAKREAEKALAAASTSEKEQRIAEIALEEVKMIAEKIEKRKYATKSIIHAYKIDILYKNIKQKYDAIFDDKRALDAIVDTMQQIINKCPKKTQGEVTTYIQTLQAAQAVAQSELNRAQQAEKNAKQLKEEILTALKNFMKTESTLTELLKMAASILDYINNAQETEKVVQNALHNVQAELEHAKKINYVESVLLSSVQADKAVNNATSYKERATQKKNEAKSAINAIEGLHKSVSIGISFIIINYLNTAEEIFETLSQQEMNAVNALNKAKDAMYEVHDFLAKIQKPNTSVNDAKSISEKAKASEIRAESEEKKTKDALESVTSCLAKITKAKQDAGNVNNKSQQGSSKPISLVTSKKQPLQNETSPKFSFNEMENETKEKQTKHTEVQIPEIQVGNNTNKTTKKNTEEQEEHNKKMNYKILIGNESSSNKEKIDEIQQKVEEISNGAENPFLTFFISLNILFWALMIFE